MNQTHVDGQLLAWRDDGAGPPLVCLHANPGDSRDFDAVVPALARRFRVIRLDWPGYGSSPAPEPIGRAGAGYCSEMLSGFVRALRLRDVVLVGNSVGGNAAVRYALQAPDNVRALVLVSSGGFTDHNPVTRAFCRAQGNVTLNRLIAPAFVRSYLRVRNPWTRAMLERAATGQSTPPARTVNALVWRSFLAPEHDLRAAARALRVPALVVGGRHDPAIPPHKDGRIAAAAIPGARQVVLDCGHAPFAEVPEAFLAEVLPFLDATAVPEARRAAG